MVLTRESQRERDFLILDWNKAKQHIDENIISSVLQESLLHEVFWGYRLFNIIEIN